MFDEDKRGRASEIGLQGLFRPEELLAVCSARSPVGDMCPLVHHSIRVRSALSAPRERWKKITNSKKITRSTIVHNWGVQESNALYFLYQK